VREQEENRMVYRDGAKPKTSWLLLPAVLLVVLLASACRPVVAPPTPDTGGPAAAESSGQNAVAFEAIDVACPDGNVVLSASPLIAGSSELAVTQEGGDPYFSIDVTMHPAAYPGATWHAPGQGFETADGKFLVFHRGDGTGALAGSRIVMLATPAEDGIELPCAPVGPVAKLEGVILSDLAEPGSGITATEFTDLDIACPDGNVVISSEPMSAGRSEVAVTQGPAEPYFSVIVTQYPDVFPGATWVAPGQGVATAGGGFFVIHQGHGTGDLEGGSIFYTVSPAEGLADLPCKPDGPVVKSEGIIIRPAGTTAAPGAGD
jgi:hypothetical protein